MESFVNLFVTILGLYVVLGIAFGVVFLVKGLKQLDPSAIGTGIGFKLIILPGIVALWPILLIKWIKNR